MAKKFFQSDKKVMAPDGKDIQPAQKSELEIVDWDGTCFLTKYYTHERNKLH